MKYDDKLELLLPSIKQYIDEMMELTATHLNRSVEALNYPHASTFMLKEDMEPRVFADMYQTTIVHNTQSGLRNKIIEWFCQKDRSVVVCVDHGHVLWLREHGVSSPDRVWHSQTPQVLSLDELREMLFFPEAERLKYIMITSSDGQIPYAILNEIRTLLLHKDETYGTHIRFLVLE